MKKLYTPYISRIENILRKRTGLSGLDENYSSFSGEDKDWFAKGIKSESWTLEPKTALSELANLLGISEVRTPIMGDHPDYQHLRQTGGYDHGYIVSVFIDVKNSTNFHRKYDLNQIAMIIQTIVTAGTQTCALFGGHIQRMQYDGIFAYFGGKNISKESAIQSAIDATSFFSFFIKHELSALFEMEEIDNIYTRIGVDFGDDDDVQWLIFGTPGCSELTTNSLHTSLAPKMQSYAPNNGIMIGENIKKKMGVIELFCDFLRDSDGNIDNSKKYIYQDPKKGFHYCQYDFKWQNYLKHMYSFVKSDEKGMLYIDDSAQPDTFGKNRANELYKHFSALQSGSPDVSTKKGFSNDGSGVSIPPHNFHFKG